LDSRIEVAAAKLDDLDRRIAMIDGIVAGAAKRGQALAHHVESLRINLEREKAETEVELEQLPTHSEAEVALRTAREHAREVRDSLQIARAALTGP
jgi:hypothetical protein